MEIKLADGAERTYFLSGRLTYKDNETFKDMIADIGSGGGRTIVIDIHALEHLDSFGIGLFLIARDEAERCGNRVVIRNPQGAVQRIFSLAKLDAALPVETAGRAPAPPPVRRVVAPPSPTRAGLAVSAVHEAEGGFLSVALSGRFTFADHDAFEDFVRAMNGHTGKRLMIDLTGLDFMDSAGLSMLLILRDEVERHGNTLELAAAGRVAQLLR
ncbi:MAG TPA: STAS domain-containing protein, partial [Candidatus Omnitrophota bacterium]|nr:STAS domain-containing protein [Candidatus Omnitrophota bacterium]